MSNLRIVYDNAAKRATLTASSTAGALVSANLLTDKKSDVWRATGTTAVLTATWAAAETISCAALAFCNLSPTATIRVQLYDATTGGNLLLDVTGNACPAPAISLTGWTAAQAASAYAYGGGAMGRIWFAATSGVKRMVITITDTANLQGYIEAACLVVGKYWSPTSNASDAPLAFVDSSTDYRTGAGDLASDAGTVHSRLSIDFSLMPPADRSAMANILRQSRANPVFVSVYPESADLALERDNTVYGKRTEDSEIAIAFATAYGTTVPIESI